MCTDLFTLDRALLTDYRNSSPQSSLTSEFVVTTCTVTHEQLLKRSIDDSKAAAALQCILYLES